MQTRNNNQTHSTSVARNSTQMDRARKHAIGVSAILMILMLTIAITVTTLAINPWRPGGGNENQPPPGQEVSTPIVFALPFNVAFDIIKGYSENDLQWNQTAGQWQGHRGVKIAVGQGTPVLATYAGTITNIVNDSLEGTIVEITHRDGVMTRYMGLASNTTVKRGDIVQRGQQIGTVGGRPVDHKDGPHVKLEVLKDGRKVNPADFIPNLDGGNK